MTRALRSQQHGWFHITNRGVDRHDIYGDDLDRRVFLDELGQAAELFNVEVHAYCLMTTHFHIVVYCPEGQLSRFVQRFAGRYGHYFNRRAGREGSVFTGRFVAVPLSTDADDDADDSNRSLKVVARYVHRNPLDFLSIKALAAYAYSSYGVYVAGRTAPEWLTVDLVGSLHANDPERIRRFTEQSLSTDSTPAYGRSARTLEASDVLASVARASERDVDTLATSRPGVSSTPRAIAAHLCLSMRTGTPVELAAIFGLSTPQGLRKLAARGKRLVAIDESAASLSRRALAQMVEFPAAA